MALSTVTVTWDETDIGQNGLSGFVKFAPSGTWTDTLGGTVIEPQTLSFPILNSAGQSTPLIANDSAGLLPSGSYYVITVQIPGVPPRSFNAFINHASGASQTLGSLNPLSVVPAQLAYLPLPSGGPPSAGQVPSAIGDGSQNSAWGSVAARIVSGQYLCTPVQYAPASQTTLTVSTTTMAAFSSANVNTGAFTAPASGSVVVTASFTAQASAAAGFAVGLAAHGTVTPLVCNSVIPKFPTSTTATLPVTVLFIVSGLTPGSSFNFDLVGCATTADNVAILAIGNTSTTPTVSAGGQGSPVIMIVQAI